MNTQKLKIFTNLLNLRKANIVANISGNRDQLSRVDKTKAFLDSLSPEKRELILKVWNGHLKVDILGQCRHSDQELQEQVLSYRREYGAFGKYEDVLQIKGLTPKRFRNICNEIAEKLNIDFKKRIENGGKVLGIAFTCNAVSWAGININDNEIFDWHSSYCDPNITSRTSLSNAYLQEMLAIKTKLPKADVYVMEDVLTQQKVSVKNYILHKPQYYRFGILTGLLAAEQQINKNMKLEFVKRFTWCYDKHDLVIAGELLLLRDKMRNLFDIGSEKALRDVMTDLQKTEEIEENEKISKPIINPERFYNFTKMSVFHKEAMSYTMYMILDFVNRHQVKVQGS